MLRGWEGQRVRLVPLDYDRHFDNCLRWLNDPEVTRWTLIGDFPLTRVAERSFFDRLTRGDDHSEIALAIETLGTEEEPSEHVGITGLHQVDFRHGTAITGTFIGRPKLWGRGLGADAVAVRTYYAFAVLGLRLLLSEVMADNTRSHRVLLRNGYRETGRVPQRYWKRGAFRDVIYLALARDDWQPQVSAAQR